MHVVKLTLLLALVYTAVAATPVLTIEPRELRGLPGEPLSAWLTVETTNAKPILISVPSTSNLVIRTIEKIPIQRNTNGRFIQRRRIIWQGIEAGRSVIDHLSINQDGVIYTFPTLEITIDAVQPAAPPLKEDAP